ncbi:MAG: phage virion morphogenesis protein [Pelagimonas sp.]|uniref:phage virion morphogenesis protein n=1 Tax=Pelagimonas sp. TaxID=2073170 RepID=UPI003D6B1A9F
MIRQDVTTDEITTALARMVEAYDDLTPLNQDIGVFMLESTKQNFVAGTSPDGTPWAPKSMATMDAYRRSEAKGANGAVPVQPLIGVSKALSTTISYEADPEGVNWGSNQIYAAVMQMGAQAGEFGARIGKDKNGRDFMMSIPWGDIPARPFLGIGPEDETGILEIIEDYLKDAAGD